MKKLMIAAAAAAMIGGASAIESANIVGYQQVALPEKGKYAVLAPTFVNVKADTFDIKDLAIVRKDGTALTSKNKVTLQKLKVDGNLDSTLIYNTSKGGWTSDGSAIAAGEYLLRKGESFYLLNNDNAGSELAFNFSGEVALVPVSTVEIAPKNYAFIGNFTPVKVDLKDVKVYSGGADVGTSKNKVTVQMLKTDGNLDSIIIYNSSKGGWTSDGSAIVAGAYMIDPGQGLYVYNGDATKTITLKFPEPITE